MEKEKIIQKYDSRENLIGWLEGAGILIGYCSALGNITYSIITRSEPTIGDAVEMLGGFALGTFSVVLGDYLLDRNEKKKQKTLKQNNLETISNNLQ